MNWPFNNDSASETCKNQRSDVDNRQFRIVLSDNHNNDTFGDRSDNAMAIFARWWLAYRTWAQNNETRLVMLDEVLNWLWTPLAFRFLPGQWNEAIAGIIQLHRLAFELAFRSSVDLAFESKSYGTSAILCGVSWPQTDVPVQLARAILTVLRSIWPTIYNLCHLSLHETKATRYEASARQIFERIRCFLRLFILARYWRRYYQESRYCSIRESLKPEGKSRTALHLPGILVEGGILTPQQQTHFDRFESMWLLRSDLRWYAGRRTGLRLNRPSQTASDIDPITVVVGELLNVLRPWLQAEMNCVSSAMFPSSISLWKVWIVALITDCISLIMLHPLRRIGNEATQAEWHRRRLRLVMHALRSPFWMTYAEPFTDRLDLTFWGRWLSSYIRFRKVYSEEE